MQDGEADEAGGGGRGDVELFEERGVGGVEVEGVEPGGSDGGQEGGVGFLFWRGGWGGLFGLLGDVVFKVGGGDRSWGGERRGGWWEEEGQGAGWGGVVGGGREDEGDVVEE